MSNLPKKRKLTEQEIADILDFIRPNPALPKKTAENICKNLKESITTGLRKKEVYPEIIPELKKEIEKMYYKSKTTPGDNVGIIAGQSIGEKQTQNTLDSFHAAGITQKTVLKGVPRFEELINTSKTPKAVSCSVYFTEGTSSINELRKLIGHSIVELKLKNIALNFEIYETSEAEEEEWEKIYRILYNDNFSDFPFFIEIDLDLQKLFEFSLDTEFIARKIEEKYSDIFCTFPPLQNGKLRVYMRDAEPVENFKKQQLYITQENKWEIYTELVVDKLKNELICGIPHIYSIFFVEKIGGEWMVETEGTNYAQLLAHPYVDVSRTTSNDMWDIFNTLGLFAVKKMLLQEFMSLMSNINECHARLLVNMMTYDRTIRPMSRFTMKKQETGPLMKGSFEVSMEKFSEASLYGETDPTTGVSASIICGKRARMGTGLFDLKLDTQSLGLGKIKKGVPKCVKESYEKKENKTEKKVENKKSKPSLNRKSVAVN